MFPATSAAARRSSFVTLRTGQSALNTTSASTGAGVRHFRTVQLRDLSVLKPTDQFKELMQSQRQTIRDIEAMLDCSFADLPSKRAWIHVVKKLDTLAQQEKSPLQALSGEASLALLLTVFEAGFVCGENFDPQEVTRHYPALAFNLHRLGDLVMTKTEIDKIDRLAQCALHAFIDLMPSTGRGFTRISANERADMIRHFTVRLARDAHGLGLGLRDEDLLAFEKLPVQFEKEIPLAGGLCTTLACGTSFIALSEAWLGESEELERLIDEEGRTPNIALLELVDTITHEMVHLCHVSARSGAAANMEHFKQRLALTMSSAACMALTLDMPAEELPVLPPHELAAWYAGAMVWDAFNRSPFVEPAMRQSARVTIRHPRHVEVAAQLKGEKPREFLRLPATGQDDPSPAIPLHLLGDW